MEAVPIEDLRLLMVIAGHNGAGKTTIYEERIAATLSAHLDIHINPDEIERSITTDSGDSTCTKADFERLAAKEGERLRRQFLDDERSFSFETVFSDPVQDKVQFMVEARQRGYLVILLAVGLESADKSKARVAIRHAKGGHDVNPQKIEERYPRVLTNFAHGAREASLAIFMDNSEDRRDDGQDTYWDIAFFEDGHLRASENAPPDWWGEVLRVFRALPH